ncbi:MAG: TetR family transcriptional regulator [Planctomycetia bacterium]|nr:TetR family transcriptional regulator [Planctomycetia bacterium]
MTLSAQQATREKLIHTTGQLIADKGLRVTTRAIAEASGKNIGCIHYHFGGKVGLVHAVLEYATNGWRNHESVIEYIVSTSAEDLHTSDGRFRIISKVMDLLFNDRCAPGRPVWEFPFFHQILSGPVDSPFRRDLLERVIIPNHLSVSRLLQALCPELSMEETEILNTQLFLSPLTHYAVFMRQAVSSPSGIPYTQAFILNAKRVLTHSAWLIIENRRGQAAGFRSPSESAPLPAR